MAESKVPLNWCIYVLKCPRTQEVRYVGWTNRPSRRLYDHIWESKRTDKTHKNKWIRQIISAGLIPIIEFIETGQSGEWAESEKKWIAHYKAIGADLVNGTIGGDGIVGWGTPEQRSELSKRNAAALGPERRSLIAKNREAAKSPEQRSATARAWAKNLTHEQISELAKLRAKALTPEQRTERARRGQMLRSRESRLASAQKRLATMTPEMRTEAAKKAAAAQSPEKRSELSRQRWIALSDDERNTKELKRQLTLGPERRSEIARKRERNKAISRQQRVVAAQPILPHENSAS